MDEQSAMESSAVLQGLETVVNWGSQITWGGLGGYWWCGILIAILLPVGVYFTVRMRFIQLRGFAQMLRVLKQSTSAEHEGNVTSFQAFATSAAARGVLDVGRGFDWHGHQHGGERARSGLQRKR